MFNTIANICSILGLFLAFWQIWEVRKKLKSTQNTLHKLRAVFVVQKMDIPGTYSSPYGFEQDKDEMQKITAMIKDAYPYCWFGLFRIIQDSKRLAKRYFVDDVKIIRIAMKYRRKNRRRRVR